MIKPLRQEQDFSVPGPHRVRTALETSKDWPGMDEFALFFSLKWFK